MTDEDWLAYYLEAEDAMTLAIYNQAEIWLNGDAYNNGYLAAEAEVARASARWRERLTAFNARMDATAKQRR